MQRHLGGDAWQSLHQEVGCAHPCFDRAEGMLDRLTPQAHLFRMLIEAALHGLKKIKRLSFADAFKKLPPCIVGMEACLSAHFVSRTLRALGHEPRIIPAIYVKPFVKGQKNDYNDAEAIAEAALRPNLRTVQEKSQDQLDLQACHRVRSRLVSRGPRQSIRSERSYSSKGSRSGRERVPCVNRSSRY